MVGESSEAPIQAVGGGVVPLPVAPTVTFAVAVWPAVLRATIVNVVAPETAIPADPLGPTALPLMVAEVALVVDQVTFAQVGDSSVAWIVAVGAVVEPPPPLPPTVTFAVAVWPAVLRATIVNVVAPETAIPADPLGPTALPLMVAEVALVVDQVTFAQVGDSSVAWIVAVGAVVEPPPPLPPTVTFAVAVWPAVLRATIVNVVAPETAIPADPLGPTALPLMVAEVALVVDQVTFAQVGDSSVAWIVAVGAVVEPPPPLPPTVTFAVAVWPAVLRATIVNVVAPETAIPADPLGPTALPLMVAEVALVVDQVTLAQVGDSSVAWIVAVGAVVEPPPPLPPTVTFAVAVWPAVLRATIVNVVAPETAIPADPLGPTALPLMVAEVALVVDQVTLAQVGDSSVAWIVAVGAGGAGVELPPTVTVASDECGPYWYDAL